MSVIYQPSGRAREYAEWACNLFKSCPHACSYCYVPTMPWGPSRYDFHKGSIIKKDVIQRLRQESAKHTDSLMVHLCFTCDPYPTVRANGTTTVLAVTREAIYTLKQAGHHIQILTKGGLDSIGDFDLLDKNDEYAATLTFNNSQDSRLWEPHASMPHERLEALNYACRKGIPTWASLEPVVYPGQSLSMLEQAITAGVSKVKVGPLNYKGRLPKWLADTMPTDIDWTEFATTVQATCDLAGVEAILKDDLKKLAGLA